MNRLPVVVALLALSGPAHACEAMVYAMAGAFVVGLAVLVAGTLFLVSLCWSTIHLGLACVKGVEPNWRVLRVSRMTRCARQAWLRRRTM